MSVLPKRETIEYACKFFAQSDKKVEEDKCVDIMPLVISSCKILRHFEFGDEIEERPVEEINLISSVLKEVSNKPITDKDIKAFVKNVDEFFNIHSKEIMGYMDVIKYIRSLYKFGSALYNDTGCFMATYNKEENAFKVIDACNNYCLMDEQERISHKTPSAVHVIKVAFYLTTLDPSDMFALPMDKIKEISDKLVTIVNSKIIIFTTVAQIEDSQALIEELVDDDKTSLTFYPLISEFIKRSFRNRLFHFFF